jgi:hypothetical protein
MSTIPASRRPLRSRVSRRRVPPRVDSILRGAALEQIWNGR